MDFPGEPWVRTREGRVALPKGGEGDMLHSQLVKLGQLQGRKEVRANQSKWIISEEPITTIQSQSDDHKHHRWCQCEETHFPRKACRLLMAVITKYTDTSLATKLQLLITSRDLHCRFNRGMLLLLVCVSGAKRSALQKSHLCRVGCTEGIVVA